MAGPRSPTSPVTAQLNLRRWKRFSSWCYADCQQRLNERLVVLPQTRSSFFHSVKAFLSSGWYEAFQKRSSKCLGTAPPNTAQFLSRCWTTFFRLDDMQPFKTIQVYGWAALPNIPCHDPAHFAALRSHFVLMLCRLSTTFKSTAGRAPPNTIQLISRCQTLFSFGWYEAFQKHSILWLGRAPPNTAQFLSRCWSTFSSGCYAHV